MVMSVCKHRPRRSSGLRPDVTRPVELPRRLDLEMKEELAVVLGTDPRERYTTVSRLAYTPGASAAGAAPGAPPTLPPGEPPQRPLPRGELQALRRERERFMRDKNFSFGFEAVHLPLVSESRGAQQSAVDLRRAVTASPEVALALNRPVADLQGTAPRDEIREHRDMMRRSSIFTGLEPQAGGGAHAPPPVGVRRPTGRSPSLAPPIGAATATPAAIAAEAAAATAAAAAGQAATSEHRAAYSRVDPAISDAMRRDAARLRAAQAETHWAPKGGPSPKDWATAKTADYTGRFAPAAKLSEAATSTVAVGASNVRPQDILQSLKARDFPRHQERQAPPASINCHDHTAVLGSHREPAGHASSTYRVSYTPTAFTAPGPEAKRPRTFVAPK